MSNSPHTGYTFRVYSKCGRVIEWTFLRSVRKEILMKYRKLGDSDFSVSEISLGSWLTYGVGVDRDRAVACVNRAFELGINFIDTANAYGRGAAESFLGEVLAGRPRPSYLLATKLYFPMSATDKG